MEEKYPNWMNVLDGEDFAFIKRFIFSSGSLKEMAELYRVTYPTVRLRLDRLIQKITLSENESEDGYIAYIKTLALDEKISVDAARLLINAYKKEEKKYV